MSRFKNVEENRKVLMNKSFLGNYLNDKLNINVNNVGKLLTNDCTTIYNFLKQTVGTK